MPRFLSRLFGLALLFAVVASAFMGRPAIAQDGTPCPVLTEEEAAAWATAYFTAWNSHDPAAVTALHTPDTIQHWGIGIDVEGTEELAASLEAFFTAFPGVRTTVDQVWVAEDSVVVRWISIGIQENDFMGVAGSLDTVTWTGISVMQLDCGLVAEIWSEADHFGRLEQMGLIPMAPEAEATPAA